MFWNKTAYLLKKKERKRERKKKEKKITPGKWAAYKVKTLDFWAIKVLYLKIALMEISSTQAKQNTYILIFT